MAKPRVARTALAESWRAVLSIAVCTCVAGCSAPSAVPPAHTAARALPSALERDVLINGRRLRYHLQLAEQPNLVYQLDCVTGVALCAQPIYLELWDTFRLDAADRAALVTWKSLRNRHAGELRRVDATRPPQPLLAPAGVFSMAERQRIGGLRARSPATYQESLALLSSDADASELRSVVERFAARFAAWWRERGFAAGEAFLARFERLLADPFMDDTIEKAAAFYEVDLPGATVFRIHLVVQPRSAKKLSVAYQLEGDAVVEVREGTVPEDVIDVVTHELFHYFFFRMPPQRQAELLEAVGASTDPYAVVSFGLLDEAVAAALGNGIVGRHYQTLGVFEARMARGFVQNEAAGSVARELFALMPTFLDRGTPVSSREFLQAFYAAAQAAYPGGRPRPLDYLHSLISVAEPRFASAARHLHDAAYASFPYLREYAALDGDALGFLAAHPLVSSVLFLPSDASVVSLLDPLAPEVTHIDAISSLLRKGRGFVYALPRTDKSYAFLFVGSTLSVMEELVDRFIALAPAGNAVLIELAQ